MIPADVASRLQVSADAALRPVAPAQEIADISNGVLTNPQATQILQSLC